MIRPIDGLVYLASPYTHPDPAIREERFRAVCGCAATLKRAGWSVFCPVAHSHPITLAGAPGDWPTWKRVDFPVLAICKALIILQLPGWAESVGVAEEMAYVRRKNRPVLFLPPAGGRRGHQ
jgi:hypothetical protein